MIDVAAANASLDSLSEADAAIARLCARRAEHLMALIGQVGPEPAEGDIAGTLKLTRVGAARRAEIAVQVTSLPHLLQVMHEGRVDEHRVLAVFDEMDRVLPLSDPRWDAVDRVVALVAPGLDAAQLRKHVQKLLIELDPDKAREENLKAKQRRQVRRYARAHGMSSIVVDLSAEDAAVVMATLNAIADLVPKDDPRSRDQVMADSFVEVFKAIGDGRAMRLVPVPAPTPPRDPAEPDHSRIPEQWMRPDTDLEDDGTGAGHAVPAPETRCPDDIPDQDPLGPDPAAAGAAAGVAAGGEPPECESPSDLPRFVADLWHPPALGTRQGERVRVVLHIEADALLGKDDLPAYLVGQGYITAHAGRDLARQCDSIDLVVRPYPSHRRPPPDPDPDPGPSGGPGGPAGSGTGPSGEPGEPGEPGERPRGEWRGGADLLELMLRDRNRQQRRAKHDDHPPTLLAWPQAQIRVQTRARVRTEHVHDPHHGEYRPHRALARRVRARNPYCRAPGCTRPAVQCDLDHATEWPHGITCDCNLLPLCRFHHNLKTTGYWRYVMHHDGSIIWTTLLGRQYHQPPPGPF